MNQMVIIYSFSNKLILEKGQCRDIFAPVISMIVFNTPAWAGPIFRC